MCSHRIHAHRRAGLRQVGSDAWGAVGAMGIFMMADNLHVQFCAVLLECC